MQCSFGRSAQCRCTYLQALCRILGSPEMESSPYSAVGKSFEIHEWRGSGPAQLHVHHSDDEAWHVLEGELTFRYADRTEVASAGSDGVRNGWCRSRIYCVGGCSLPDSAHSAVECSDCGSACQSGPESLKRDLSAVRFRVAGIEHTSLDFARMKELAAVGEQKYTVSKLHAAHLSHEA